MDGVGNELLVFLIAYFSIFIAILLTNGFSYNSLRFVYSFDFLKVASLRLVNEIVSMLNRNLKYIWSYLKSLFGRNNVMVVEEQSSEETASENEQSDYYHLKYLFYPITGSNEYCDYYRSSVRYTSFQYRLLCLFKWWLWIPRHFSLRTLLLW